MPTIAYEDKKFAAATLAIIDQANEILQDYEAQGYTLTLRQLYYQFVARALIANRQSEYKRLGSIVNDGRLAGLIDWNHLEDRTRNLRGLPHWDSPADIIKASASQFRYDLWADQPAYCEVWVEKDALVGVVERICNELDVPYFACRGYTSQSEAWRAGRRMLWESDRHERVVVFHLGDHDPSGIDMTRDNQARLGLFGEAVVEVQRLALNMDQVEHYNPPPNPAKITDSRATGYIREYGRESWELDALEPRVISALIRENVEALIDRDLWNETKARQEAARAKLRKIAENWSD